MSLDGMENDYSGNLSYNKNDEMEDIILKPSTELIPDEYEHVNNKDVLVHFFVGEYKHDANNSDVFSKSLENIGYDVPIENVHKIKKKETVLAELQSIADSIENKSGLIILFLDVYREDDRFMLSEDPKEYITTKDVWINFSSYKCPSLANKPKIFIFQAVKYIESNINHDSIPNKMPNSKDSLYQLPGEADILIVYKKVELESENHRRLFFHDLCKRLEENGKRDDIITMITMTESLNSSRPLIISTLTKNFYFTSSKLRGHYYDLHSNHTNIAETLDVVHQKIDEVVQKDQNHRKTSALLSRRNKPPTLPISGAQVVTDSVPSSFSKKLSTQKEAVKPKKKLSLIAERPRWKY